MIEQVSYKNEALRWIVLACEFVLLNIFIATLWFVCEQANLTKGLVLWNISYILAIAIKPPVVHLRIIRAEQIATRAFQGTIISTIVFYVLISMLNIHAPNLLNATCAVVGVFYIIFLSRLLCRKVIKNFRAKGRNTETAVFVGAGVNLKGLYDAMTQELSTGYRVCGYFENHDSPQFDGALKRLGNLNEVQQWLEKNRVHIVFCNLPSAQSETILGILNFCENNLIHFYSVPNVRNYVHHSMQVQFISDIPVLSLRREPMRRISARLMKRTFDLVFSLFVIVFFLWWFTLIVALITKITMPGPVFFKQKRNGLEGKEFYCLKFRSMAVNANADKLQATANDSRITRWGSIMRKTNIDELPQFFNVLMGDMSIVGPRPHMVLHTNEYGKLINKYMVRHYAKPGITGWAQVTGSRGETKELKDMEERIHKDIWYVENWTFMLDIRIIFLTIFNMFGGEKGNAY